MYKGERLSKIYEGKLYYVRPYFRNKIGII
jgi:hypothetical protein